MLQSGIMDSLYIQYSTWHSRAQLRTAQRGKSLPGAITRCEYCTGNIFDGCFHIKIILQGVSTVRGISSMDVFTLKLYCKV